VAAVNMVPINFFEAHQGSEKGGVVEKGYEDKYNARRREDARKQLDKVSIRR
jgi:hypothetical protein